MLMLMFMLEICICLVQNVPLLGLIFMCILCTKYMTENISEIILYLPVSSS